MSEPHTEAEMNLAGKLARGFLTSKLTALFILAVTLTGLLALVATPREYNPQIVVPAAYIIVAKGAALGRLLVSRPLFVPAARHDGGADADAAGVEMASSRRSKTA